MGVLRSDLFKDDKKLEACATTPSAHIVKGSPSGRHIARIHEALEKLRPRGPAVSAAEKASMVYGETTAAAVLNYKTTHVPPIVNTAYESKPDDKFGQMTVKAMDDDLAGGPAPRNKVVDQAFADSRAALRKALFQLTELRTQINALPGAADPAFGAAMAKLLLQQARNIAVVGKRLLIVPDPNSKEFRDALDKVIRLCELNLATGKTLLAAGVTGLCDPTNARNINSGVVVLPFAWTIAAQPDPKTHLCEPFFGGSRDLQRDVVTHEYFHILGLADVKPCDTRDKALNNANTLAQIVAFTADRFRQANSDGHEPAVPPLPSP